MFGVGASNTTRNPLCPLNFYLQINLVHFELESTVPYMMTAIIGLLGALTGAVLQYFFTRHLENQKHYRDLRTQAYTDYLKGVCEQAQLVGQPISKENREVLAKTADAKARICLYGSKKAVEAFAEFEKIGASMKTQEQRRTFSNMVAIMRTDSGSEQGVHIEHLEVVLMGHRD